MLSFTHKTWHFQNVCELQKTGYTTMQYHWGIHGKRFFFPDSPLHYIFKRIQQKTILS